MQQVTDSAFIRAPFVVLSELVRFLVPGSFISLCQDAVGVQLRSEQTAQPRLPVQNRSTASSSGVAADQHLVQSCK